MPHLVVDVSGHGLGHLGQVVPVLKALRRALPALRLTLRTTRSEPLVACQLGLEAAVAPPAVEAAIPMRDPLTVDAAATAQAFAALHADWPAAVACERRALARLAPDAVLADVPYTGLQAAAELGVPATAMCSFNWLEAYAAYAGQRPEARRIQAQIHAAYEAADRFLQPRPHTAMHGLTNTRSIAPVARVGTPRSRQLRERLGVGPETALVLITWGGMGGAVFSALPRCPGVVWLQPDAPGGRPDVRDTARIGLAHTDLIASVDAVVTKSGYATLAEAGQRHGFGVEAAATHSLDGARVSSTRVREALAAGDLDAAAKLLGGRYTMRGRVVHGQKLGRDLGYPTANIPLDGYPLPLTGVIAVLACTPDGRRLPGVANLGWRPTVAGTRPLLEVYAFDFSGDLYGQHLSVELVERLRPEEHFDSLDELIECMHEDARRARGILQQRGITA